MSDTATYDPEAGTGVITVRGKKLSGRAAEVYQQGLERREQELRDIAADRQIIVALVEMAGGWERLLRIIARNSGMAVCEDAAKRLGLNFAMFSEDTAARVRTVTQTVTVNPSADYGADPTHAPEVVELLMKNAPVAAVNAAIDAARERIEAGLSERLITVTVRSQRLNGVMVDDAMSPRESEPPGAPCRCRRPQNKPS
jgi:hypothetical protein